MKTALTIVAILAMVLVGTACAIGGDAGSGKVDIRGRITSVSTARAGTTDTLGSILIEGAIEPDTGYDKASVRITRDSKITRRSGESVVEAKFEDLRVGQKVEAEFIGPVAESYPVQTTAGRVVIIE